MKERDVSFGAILIFSKHGLSQPHPAFLPGRSTGHCGLHEMCRWLSFGADDSAFCSVRRFAFSRRIPDLGLCLARRSGRRRIHRCAKRPNAWQASLYPRCRGNERKPRRGRWRKWGHSLLKWQKWGQSRVVRTGLAPTLDTTWSKIDEGTNHLSSLNATVASGSK